MIFSCADGSLSIWSTKTYEMLYKRNFTMKKLRRMDLSPDGSTVAISRGDHAISILSTSDYSEINTIQGDSSFNVVRFSPDGKFILAGDKNAHLHRISIADGAILESLPAHYWAIYDICYSPNEALFATASRDKIVKVWNANEHKVLARLEGRKEGAHTHSVNAIFWQEQDRLISAGDDGDVRVWELKAD
jgi:WD40 repeat protein